MKQTLPMPITKTKPNFKDFAVVDLFCGVGGLTHGFLSEKFNVTAGVDFDETCQFAYEQNNNSEFLHKDVTSLTKKELNFLFGKNKRKILVGCAPCQPFSIFNKKNDVEEKLQRRNDNKWRLLYTFVELIESTKPEIVSMENVPLLLAFNKGKVFNDFVSRLEGAGYCVTSYLVNAQDYGVPQRRKRLVLFGSKHGKIELIPPIIKDKNYITVRDAIGYLPPIKDGETHPDDLLHRARKLSDLSKKRIKASRVGKTWQDWDEELQLNCHKQEGGKKYKSVYGRMRWNEVAPTMTTYCIGLNNGRFGHPKQTRAISLREAALLQSFPKNYEFITTSGNFSSSNIARHIGNAVPVLLGKAIAKSIKQHITSIGKKHKQ
jgi:DNA (cytosine-5)-methyltransferase 1